MESKASFTPKAIHFLFRIFCSPLKYQLANLELLTNTDRSFDKILKNIRLKKCLPLTHYPNFEKNSNELVINDDLSDIIKFKYILKHETIITTDKK